MVDKPDYHAYLAVVPDRKTKGGDCEYSQIKKYLELSTFPIIILKK